MLILVLFFSGIIFSSCKINSKFNNFSDDNPNGFNNNGLGDNTQNGDNSSIVGKPYIIKSKFSHSQILYLYNKIYDKILFCTNNTNLNVKTINSRTDYEYDKSGLVNEDTTSNTSNMVITYDVVYDKIDFNGDLTEIWYFPTADYSAYNEYSKEQFINETPQFYVKQIDQQWDSFLGEQISLFAPTLKQDYADDLTMVEFSNFYHEITLSIKDTKQKGDGVGNCLTKYKFTLDNGNNLIKYENYITYTNILNQPLLEISSISDITYNNAQLPPISYENWK